MNDVNPVIDLATLEGDFQTAKSDWKPEEKTYDDRPVPDGKYQARVEKAELAKSQNGNPMLKWQMEIVQGPHTKRRLWRQNMLLTPDNFKWLLSDLHLCGVTLERLADLEGRVEDLLDTLLEVTVKNGTDREGRPSQKVYLNKQIGTWTPDPSAPSTHTGAPGNDDVPFSKENLTMKTISPPKVTAIGGESPSNGAAAFIENGTPYQVEIELTGVSDLLFHLWNVEAVEAKAQAAKNSKSKKSDDVESYVYRNPKGEICLPGEYVRQAIIGAAKFRQDPRSPRKSAMDLYRAGVVSNTPLASLGVTKWDYEDKRRVQVQRNGITRARPAITAGWKAVVHLSILVPEYVSPADLHDTITMAGKLVGVGDFRPSFGRFQITRFEVLS